MTVRKLILRLLMMPFKADVAVVWDGASRSNVDYAWLDRNGNVQLCDRYESAIDEDARPTWAPNDEENPHWGPGPDSCYMTDDEMFEEHEKRRQEYKLNHPDPVEEPSYFLPVDEISS